MKKLKLPFATCIMVLVSGCFALHSGYMTNSAALNSANFSYVKQNIKGYSTATYILGIGGNARETLVDEAKQQMLESNPLQENQALVNVTVNFKSSFLLLKNTVRCIVTADVVEFHNSQIQLFKEEKVIGNKTFELKVLYTISKISNLRKTNEPDGEIIAQIPANSKIFVIEKGESVYKIQYESKVGYISKNSLIIQD